MKNNNGLKVIIGVAVVVVVIFLMYRSSYNNLIELKQKAQVSSAKIDAQLQRRSELIPDLVNTVKGYSAHEEKVLTEVTKARSGYDSAETIDDKLSANNQLNKSISVVLEAYPDLKANESFIRLQDELAGSQNRITVAITDYNEAVGKYNIYRNGFLTNFFFGSKFAEMKTYEIPKDSTKKPTVDFNEK